MVVYLETERLILRRFTPDDLDDLVALDCGPRGHALHQRRPADAARGDARRLPPVVARVLRARRRVGLLGGDRARDRRVPRLVPPPAREEDPPDEPELGYRLVRSAWGKGYATEGSRALVDKAFAELGARRVYAATMVVNTGSWRVMEKSGLRFVRYFVMPWPDRIEGEEHGDVEYAITREEWERTRGAPGRRRPLDRRPRRRLGDRLELRVGAELEDQRAEQHQRPTRELDRPERLAEPQRPRGAPRRPARAASGSRPGAAELRIADRNSSDEIPPPRRRRGAGPATGRATGTASAGPRSGRRGSRSRSRPTTETDRFTSVAASAGTDR